MIRAYPDGAGAAQAVRKLTASRSRIQVVYMVQHIAHAPGVAQPPVRTVPMALRWCVLGLGVAGTLLAQAPAPKAPVPLTAADLESFLDGYMPLQVDHGNIGGAVIAVVKDGKVLFAKGYGYADVAHKRPIVPESTLFRPGSISKLFTWTAVMQQVEQGKLDLDKDINSYLDFPVPPAFGKPITLRDIMTHRAGFEETIKQLFVKTAPEMMPRRTYLIEHMPKRIY